MFGSIQARSRTIKCCGALRSALGVRHVALISALGAYHLSVHRRLASEADIFALSAPHFSALQPYSTTKFLDFIECTFRSNTCEPF